MGRKPKQVRIGKTTYPGGVPEIAEKYGVPPTTIRARRRKGWSWEQSVGIEPVKTANRSDAVPLEIDGKTYNAAEAARAFGVPGGKPGHKIRKRLKAGWTDRQAVELDPPPRLQLRKARQRFKGKHRAYPIPDGSGTVYLITNSANGKQYVGITASTFRQRMAQYRSALNDLGEDRPIMRAMRKYGIENFRFEIIDQSATTYPELLELEQRYISEYDTYRNGYNATAGGEIGGRVLRIGDEEYPSVAVAALAHGLDPGTLVSRLRRGMAPEVAVSFVYRKRYKVRDPARGIIEGNLTELCDAYGIQFMQAYQRLAVGWTIEEVVGLKKHDHAILNEPVKVARREFPNFRAACDYHGVSYKLAWRRRNKRNWTIEQSLGVDPPPSTSRHGGQRVKVGKRVFRTKTAAMKALGISYEKLMKRIADGSYEIVDPM